MELHDPETPVNEWFGEDGRLCYFSVALFGGNNININVNVIVNIGWAGLAS